MKEETTLHNIEKHLTEIKQLLHQIISDRNANATQETNAYLNVKEAAKLLGVEPSNIYAKCQQGNLPHIRVGKYYKFDKSELLKWMKHFETPALNVDEYVDKYLQKHLFRG